MPHVVDHARLPANWPTNRGVAAFWEELGRAVATFTYLEDILARAYFGLTASREFNDVDAAIAAFPRWEEKLKESLTDALSSLTSKLEKALKDDDRVSADDAEDIVARLDELRVWRNALCHGAWHGFEADGSACLRHFRKAERNPEPFANRLTRETIRSIRKATVGLTVDILEVVSAAGVQFPGAACRDDLMTRAGRKPISPGHQETMASLGTRERDSSPTLSTRSSSE